MMNLLSETLDKMKDLTLFPNDVSWVGSENGEYAMDWDEFAKIADVEYDAGYGAQEIATDLVVVFKDGCYLKRHEYDGAEWWEDHSSHASPVASSSPKKFSQVKTSGWASLKDINQEEEKQ